jgi:hypothetical protein
MRTAPRLALVVSALASTTPAHADDKAACVAAADEGQVLRDKHRLREAREKFVACARDTCPAPVRKQCGEWLGAVEAGLPTVVLVATSGGQEVADVSVSLDGVPLLERLGTEAIPVDPGTHLFRFERAGYAPVDQSVVVREGDKYLRVWAAFSAPAAAPPAPAPAPTQGPAAPPSPPEARETPPADRLDDRLTPAVDLSLVVGGTQPFSFVDAGTVGPLLAGTFEVAWRPLRPFDFSVFGDLAGGPLTIDATAASAAKIKQANSYGHGTLGLRVRWYAVRLGVDTLWLAADVGAMGESWQFAGTTADGNFNYATSMIGTGALVGIDFPLQAPWTIGIVARTSVFFGPHGNRSSCGPQAECAGEVPGGSIDQHAFVDLGLRIRWSLSTR